MSLLFSSEDDQKALESQRIADHDEHLDGDADGLGAARGLMWAGGISLVIFGLIALIFI